MWVLRNSFVASLSFFLRDVLYYTLYLFLRKCIFTFPSWWAYLFSKYTFQVLNLYCALFTLAKNSGTPKLSNRYGNRLSYIISALVAGVINLRRVFNHTVLFFVFYSYIFLSHFSIYVLLFVKSIQTNWYFRGTKSLSICEFSLCSLIQ